MALLTPEQSARITKSLDERRRTLLDDVRDTLEKTENQQYVEIIGRTPADAGDASVSDELADFNLTMLDRHVSELRAIEGAEQRMRAGTYGACPDCGGEIGFERLMAYPTALRCVRCQAQFEKTHASPGMPSL